MLRIFKYSRSCKPRQIILLLNQKRSQLLETTNLNPAHHNCSSKISHGYFLLHSVLNPWLTNWGWLVRHRERKVLELQCLKRHIPNIQGQRRSLSKMVGGAKSHLETYCIPTRDDQKAQTKLCAHKDTETLLRLSQTCLWVFECLLWRYRSAVVCCKDSSKYQGQLPGSQSMWHKPSWWRSPLTHLQSHWTDDPQTAEQLYQRNSHIVKKSSRTHNRFLNLRMW